MRSLAFTAAAQEQIRELPRDANLLRALWRHLEYVAEDPEVRTLPPVPMLHRPDRRRIDFRGYQTDGTCWRVTALCAVEPGRLVVTSLNAGRDHGFESEPE